MSTFDYVQTGNGPVTLTCRGCNQRIAVERAAAAQSAVDRHKCGRNTKNSGR